MIGFKYLFHAGCTVIGCWGCFSIVIDLSLVSVTSGFNVWKNQSFGITSNKLTAPCSGFAPFRALLHDAVHQDTPNV